MKLHLPHSLRTALLCAFSLVTTLGTSNTYAAGLHSQVSLVTYTDFGQNMGRYRVSGVNDLLSSIRQRDGGVVITYTEGHDDYTLDHYMISFESQGDNGAYAAVGYNMIATVAHNGCQNPTFTSRYIDGANSLNYRGVEYRDNIVFCMQPGNVVFSSNYAFDFKMTRLNKLITDVATSDLVPRFPADYDYSQLHGTMEYRAGSGTMTLRHLDRSIEGLTGAYVYVTGAVQKITTGGTTNQQWACFTAGGNLDPSAKGINEDNPLPFVGASGDSGSPVWIWDDASQSYLYLAAYQSGSDWFGQARGSVNFAWDCLTKFDKLIDMEQGASRTVHIKGVVARGDDETVSDGSRSTRLHLGTVEDGTGGTLTTYVGVKADNNDYIHTWFNLAPVKNNQNWYTYNETYYNVGGQRAMEIEDLFNNSNLVFRASSETGNVVEVDEDTDLGIGYLQFAINPESGLEHAEYTLQSNGKTDDGRGGQRDFMVNSSGFVVEQGVDLHVKLTNTQWDSAANDYYYREWRKVGAGDLYLEGQGSNQIFLNVGGSGTTYLNERDGYAAYNVYVGSGATVVMDSTDQIARDFTFGYNGGVLDIRGNNSMDWYRTNTNVAAQGFSINSLSEDAFITNSQAGTTLNLTYREGGQTEYLGSFVDTADGGNVRITFDAGYDANTILRGIHTDLQNEGSGITVKSGAVMLAGSNTMHAQGSATGRNTNRYFSAEDWHYADMAADVLVEGGTFILGSHARLTGDVTLGQNGSLIINEGVLNAYEYIEGGLRLEDTTSEFYRRFYGLKGDIKTAEGSMVLISFDNATTAEHVYGGSITGGGDLIVSLGESGATLRLTGDSNIGGYKELLRGGLISDNGVAALGTAADNDHAWRLYNNAYIAAKGASGDELLGMVMQDSLGTLALTQAQETDLKLGEKGYNGLIVGALEGMDVHYGTESAVLTTVQNEGKAQWILGGGGGNLIVDFILQNENAELVLGNEYTTGSVTLTNTQNSIGSITFKGQVTLDYTSEEALGGASISLNYTNRLMLLGEGSLARVTGDSSGVVLVDRTPDIGFDLTTHPDLYLGASADSVLHAAPTVAAGSAYRFGGIEGVLILDAALQDSGVRATGLVVDGQTFSGGVLELAQAAGITGAVEVRGYNEDKMLETMPRRGDITLRLSAGNALESASSLTLEDGGIVDINGTAQTFHNMDMAQGSLLTDDSAARGGSVQLDVESGRTARLAGILDVAALTKTGQGNLELSGSNYCGTFTIDSGTVTLGSSGALSTAGTTIVTRNGTLNVVNAAVNHSIRLEGGTLVVGGNNVAGSLAVAAGGSGTVTQQGNATTISAFLEVGQGGMLELRGNEYTLTNEAVNTAVDAGTISVLANKLHINNSEVADIGGTLSFDSASNQTLSSNRNGDNTTRNIAHLHIGGGTNKELRLDEVTWNTIWNIGKLTGGGKLVWDSDTTHWFATRVILNGDNDFSGSIIANRKNTASTVRPYASHLELASDGAAKAAHVELSGANGNHYMGLAINTENASMLSLKGNAYTVLYAAPSMAGVGKQQGEPDSTSGGLNVKPVSTRKATLTITGNSSTTFSGDVQGGENGMGLSLVKTGSGTQTFNGGTVVFNDVSALGGTLNLNSGGLTVNGNISLSRGAALTMSSAYTLGSGKLLTVGGLATEASAQLGAALTLDGGAISFSGEALNSSTAALSLNSLSGNSVTIDFSETSALEAGTYYLANGNWTGVSVTGVALPYMDVTFQKGSSSLMAVFSLKGGSHVWAGTPSSHTWSGDNFGPQGVSFGTTDTAVFTDAASGKDVLIGSSRTVGSLIFDSSGQYTVGSTGGSTVTASTLQQLGRGTTVVNGGISATDIQVQAGELLVRDAALLEGASSITGVGTLGIDVAGTVSLNGKLSAEDPLGVLHILSGSTYASNSQLNAGRVLVDGGAAFQLQANQSANVETGTNATVALGGSTLSGSLTLAGDTLVTSSGGTLAADVHMDGHLLTTSGNMTINKSALAGRLRVDSGTLSLTGGNYANLSDISIGSGGAIRLTYGCNITGGVHVAMEDGSVLASEAGSGTSELNIDVLGGTAEIQGCWQGNNLNVSGTISGNGTLKLGHNYGNRWTVSSSISDGSGTGDCLALAIDSQVTLSNSNSYSGGTSIDGCTVIVSNARALGTGGLTVNGGTLETTQGLRIASIGGSGGSINFNGMTLTLTGDADAVYGGAVQGTPGIVKLGAGRQEFSQAAAYGNVSVQDGTLALNATDLRGQVSVASGATLQLDGERTILHAPIYNGGALTLTGAAPVLELANDGAFAFEDATYRDIDGIENPDGNGFALNAHIQVVYMGEGASITAPAATSVTYLGDTLQLDSDGAVWLGEKSRHSYSVRQGIVTYDEAFAQKAATAGLESFLLATSLDEAPAELEITEDLPQDIVIHTFGSGGILNIGEGASLEAASLDAGASTVLKGAGSLVLAGSATPFALPQKVRLGDEWTGTVVLSGSVGGPYGFAGLSNARSYVKLAGVSTWISPNSTVGANLLLDGTDRGDRTGGAFIIIGADNNSTYTFTGSIGGSGDFVYRQDDRGARSSRFYLRGDLSGWTGNFVNYNGDAGTHPSLYLDGGGDVVMGGGIIQKRESGQSNGALDVYLGGASTTSVTIGGDVLCQGGTLNFTVNADTTFNGAVSAVNSMAVGSGKSVTFKGSADVASLTGGLVNVASGAQLQFGAGHSTLHAPIHNEGAITFAPGSVLELAADGGFEMSFTDINGSQSPNGNGFAGTTGIQVVDMAPGASLSAEAASVTCNGLSLQLGNDGVARLGEAGSHDYFVRLGKVTYDEAFAQKATTAGLESFILSTAPEQAPAELELLQDLAGGIVVHSSGSGGILNIGSGVNLDAASLDAAASTVLKGEGSLVLASGVVSLPRSVQIGSDWTGSVVLSGSVGGPYGFAGLSNARSYVKLAGVSTWIAPNSTVGANLILEGTDRGDRTGGALVIIGADNNSTYTFTGSIGGSGDFVYRQDDRGARSSRFYLHGDLSGWTGNFVNYNGGSGTHPSLYLDAGGEIVMGGGIIQKRESGQSNGVLDVYLGGASTTSVTIGGDVLCQGGTLNVTVNTDTTFNGAVTAVNSMAVGSGKSVTFKDQASIAALSGAGSVDIDSAGATVALAGIGGYTGSMTVSSGTLELGSGISSLSGQILNSELGNVVIGATLTAGTIVNRGIITVSDLMVASGATYTDAHGSSSTGNGFVSSLEVCSVGVIQDQGGTILYGGRDVTQQVLDTGRIQNVTNNATYYINSTDVGVSFSDICSASQGALEHIVFASGTSLKVDNAAGGELLHSSQLKGPGTFTLQMQDGATAVLDSGLSVAAQVDQGAAATLAVETAANIASVTTNGSLSLTGDGTVALGTSGAASLAGAGTLAIDGLSVTINGDNNAFNGNISVDNGTIVVGHNKALGARNFNSNRTITINEGGAIDLKGHYDELYAYTLNGGTLMNTGGDTGSTKMQTSKLILTDNSVLGGTGNFHIINSGYVATSVLLNGHTLVKTGDNTVGFKTTTFDAGTLEVQDGALAFDTGYLCTLSENLTIRLNDAAAGDENKLTGKVNVNKVLTLDVQQSANSGMAIDLRNSSASLVAYVENGKALTISGNVTGSGRLSKTGAGTLALSGTGSYTIGTVINEGTLEIKSGGNTTLSGVVSGSGNLLVDGGSTVTLSGANTFSGSLVVRGVLNEQGAVTATTTLVMGNNAALGADTASITIGKGGIVNLNGTSNVCYKYTLAGGALLNNGNGTNTGNKQTAGLTLTDDSSFGGSGNFKLLNSGYNAINVSLNGHTLTKTGGNTVGFYTTTFDEGTLEVQGGKLEFNDGGKGVNKFSKSAELILNVDNSGDADRVSGQVSVAKGLALRAQQSAKASVAVSLSDNATLTTGAEANQTLNMTGAVSGSASTTLAKEGDGTAILTNTGSFRGSVDAGGGILNLMNAASLAVQDVTIAAGATMGVYKDANGVEASEGTLTIKDTRKLTAGEGSRLNANLVMERGSTLDVSADGGMQGLIMGSTVTLNGNSTLNVDGADANAFLRGYLENNPYYTLFSDVEEFVFNGQEQGELGVRDRTDFDLDANSIYSNLDSNTYAVVYTMAPSAGGNVGMIALTLVPEPATSTLGLLALAALAVRRRRR